MKAFLILLVLLVIGLGIVFLAPEEEVHIHADFKVFLDGEEWNFSQEKYMSQERLLSAFTHLHDMDGDVLHVHAEDVDLKLFFRSLGMVFNSTCFVTDQGEEFCNQDGKELRLFVNGQARSEMEEYEPQELDRILVTYGSGSLEDQLASVTDKACIQSGRCPERGEPSPEASCAGDNGCSL